MPGLYKDTSGGSLLKQLAQSVPQKQNKPLDDSHPRDIPEDPPKDILQKKADVSYGVAPIAFKQFWSEEKEGIHPYIIG